MFLPDSGIPCKAGNTRLQALTNDVVDTAVIDLTVSDPHPACSQVKFTNQQLVRLGQVQHASQFDGDISHNVAEN